MIKFLSSSFYEFMNIISYDILINRIITCFFSFCMIIDNDIPAN